MWDGESRTRRHWVEGVATAVLAVAALGLFAAFVRTMATTSLWNDEIYTILKFSGKGVRTVVTDYHAPNNHVFFNLVNALLPGRLSMDPLRARAVSILASAAALLLVFGVPARHGMAFVGATAAFLLAANGNLLELVLQARGYGILLLCSAALAALLPGSLDREKWRTLAFSAALVVAGSYTVPTFVFYGGAWLAGLLAVRRDRAALLAGVGAAAVLGLLYLPLLPQILIQLRGYSAEWGREYATWGAIGETVRRYVIPASPGGTPIPLNVALALPFAVAAWSVGAAKGMPGDERRIARFCAFASLTFLVACRVLETPLIRTTSFLGPPLLLAAGLLVGRWTESHVASVVRRWGALVVALGLAAFLARPMTPARFLPIEDWRGVSRFLETTFPPDVPVHVSWAGDFLEAHGSSGRRTTVPFDDASFARGELVLFDDALEHRARLAATRSLAASAFIRFPQQRSDDGFTEVRFAPPPDRHVESLETETGRRAGPEPFDGDFRSGWSTEPEQVASGGWVTFTLAPGTPYRSLAVVLEGAGASSVRGWITFDGGWSSLPAGAVEVRGDVLLVHLGDRPVRTVHLDLGAPRHGERIVEAWAYQSRPRRGPGL